MKYFFVFISLVFPLLSFSQETLLNLPGAMDDTTKAGIEPTYNSTLKLKEVAKDTLYYIPISFIKRNPGENITIKISDENRSSADLGKDYEYIGNVLGNKEIKSTESGTFPIGILIKSRKIKRNEFSFDLSFSYLDKGKERVQKLTVSIEPFDPITPKLSVPDTSKWSVRLLTGSNFDFFDAPTFKNFAGELSIFLPNLFQFDKPKKWKKQLPPIGLQLGFFNFRYYEADSSRGHIRRENYLLEPQADQVVGQTKYISETYALNSKTSFNNFGAYFNPVIRLSKADSKWFDAYLSGHFERIWRTQTFEYIQLSIRKDTMILSESDVHENIAINRTIALRPAYTQKTFQDGYYGIGIPMVVNVKNIFKLYFNPTWGISSFVSVNNAVEIKDNIRSRSFATDRVSKAFWLTRAQLVTTVAPVDLALGGEFRKIHDQDAYYALYLGVLLSLEKLKK